MGSGSGWDIAQEVRAVLPLIPRAMPVIFDVGANIGTWSANILAARPEARLFLFEPLPECHALICKHALSDAKLIPCAVGETSGTATLYSSSPTDETASLHPRGDSFFAHRSYVPGVTKVVTLDSVIASERIEFVDFAKLDIEGHELFALRGAREALAERRIGALSFEFGSGNVNSRTFFRDYWDLLIPAGFRISRITPGGRRVPVPVPVYYEDLEYFRGVSNYVAELSR